MFELPFSEQSWQDECVRNVDRFNGVENVRSLPAKKDHVLGKVKFSCQLEAV